MRAIVTISLPPLLVDRLNVALTRVNDHGERKKLNRSEFIASLLDKTLPTLGEQPLTLAPSMRTQPRSRTTPINARFKESDLQGAFAKVSVRLPRDFERHFQRPNGVLWQHASRAAGRRMPGPGNVVATIMTARYCVPLKQREPLRVSDVLDMNARANDGFLRSGQNWMLAQARIYEPIVAEINAEANAMEVQPVSLIRALVMLSVADPTRYIHPDIVAGPVASEAYAERPVWRSQRGNTPALDTADLEPQPEPEPKPEPQPEPQPQPEEQEDAAQ